MSLLVAAPGMTLEEVQRRSDVPLGVHRRRDGSGVAQPRRPHAVHVDHVAHAFLIPEGLFTVVELVEGRVLRIVASPQLDAMPLEAALERARLLAATMERAGWNASTRPAAVEPDEVRDTLVGVWQVDGWRATLLLRPVHIGTSDLEREQLAWILSLTVDEAST